MNSCFYKALLFFFLLLISKTIFCQVNRSEYDIIYRLMQHRRGEGTIEISMEPRIEKNFQNYVLDNLKNPGVSGYRIRIYSDSGINSKDKAMEARTRFISKFENIEAYIQYDIPNYKVYVGDCRTKSEAFKILEMVKKDFPNAFIVEQNISVPD